MINRRLSEDIILLFINIMQENEETKVYMQYKSTIDYQTKPCEEMIHH